MSQASLKGIIPSIPELITNRDLSNLAADKAAVAALGQGAINVEMFTLPLYLCSMSSIQGTHEINASGNSFYKGRTWPGMSTTAGTNLKPNQQAYNTIFSVFIQEMLHLQLAANLATVLGVTPKFFNKTILENTNHGWSCYGPNNTTIPHIIDLQDTTTFSSVKVNLDELNQNQIDLFLAIEQSHDAALADIKPGALGKYFPAVPFTQDINGKPWTASSTEADLPLFGTIGWMYNSLLKYLSIEYTDGKTLWEKMFDSSRIINQRDLFNATSSGHQPEYPLMPTQVSNTDTNGALWQALDIVKGICDQGEGGIGGTIEGFRKHLQARFRAVADNYVQPQFQPEKSALVADYPSYNSDGKPTGDSADADARSTGDVTDHWQRFNSLTQVIKASGFMTWSQWFAAGNSWKASDLTTSSYAPNSEIAQKIPSPQEIADALNALKSSSKSELSTVVVGAIAGINNALSTSWGDASVAFPYPAMSGSGDRMSFYWAVFGEAPDLSQGQAASSGNSTLQHACQGLSYNKPGNNCAAQEVYHTCAGSNSCKAQGGCGFVQPTSGGHGCGAKSGCGAPSPVATEYSAPNDNKCGSFGGCAVPISASQLYPQAGTMLLDDVIGGATQPLGTMPFNVGDSVFDTAWNAYSQVMQGNGKKPGEKPAPNHLRTALPPST